MSSAGFLFLLAAAVIGLEAVKLYRGNVAAASSSAPAASGSGTSLTGSSYSPSGTPPASSGQATPQLVAQLYQDILQAGGSAQQALAGVSIALVETGGTLNPLSSGVNQAGETVNGYTVPPGYVGTTDRGLFQFNNSPQAFGNIPDSCAYDWYCSIRQFVSVTSSGNYSPWQNDVPQRSQFENLIQEALSGLFLSQPSGATS